MIVKNIKFVIIFLMLNLINSCNRTAKGNQEESLEVIRDSYFEVKGIDYLKHGEQNYVHYRYFNPEFKEYTINKDRFLKMYYVIDDKTYKKEIEEISDYNYKAIENIELNDSVYIETFGLKGEKTITFILLDLVEKSDGVDSVKLKYTEEYYSFKTEIK